MLNLTILMSAATKHIKQEMPNTLGKAAVLSPQKSSGIVGKSNFAFSHLLTVLVYDRGARYGLVLSLILDIISWRHTLPWQILSVYYVQSPRGMDLLLGFWKTCHNMEQGCSGQRGDISF